ncbi:MAG: alpha/beta hydrolase [Alphaproteobacteria bacterium]|nr:alpha/beta hydrolase [Pseudomonadota bacterium]
MPHFTSDGLKLFYEDQGSGEPLVLVHGFGQDSSAWVDVADSYARFFRVINVDLRGGGQSEVPDQSYTAQDLATDIVNLADVLDVERIHFCGFSLGGAIGMEFAIRYPERLASLSLHSTWEGGPCPSMKRWIEVRSRLIAANDPVTNIGTRIVSFFSPEFVNANEDRIELFIQRARDNPYPMTPDGIKGHAEACLTHDVRGRLDAIRTPTLITCGSMDRSTLPSQSRYLHENIADSELIFIDGDGHFTPFSSTAEYLSISLGFLMKHTGGGA